MLHSRERTNSRTRPFHRESRLVGKSPARWERTLTEIGDKSWKVFAILNERVLVSDEKKTEGEDRVIVVANLITRSCGRTMWLCRHLFALYCG